MERSRAVGFTREHRLRHFELRQHNDMPEQDGALPSFLSARWAVASCNSMRRRLSFTG
jgi:hypothetical protein